MSRIVALVALVWVALAGAAFADVTLVRAGRVYVDFERPPLTPGVVAVRGDRIIGVGRDASDLAGLGVQAGEAVETVDLGGRTLLPGLIDSHVHLSSEPGRPFWTAAVQSGEYATLIGAKNARVTLLAGFTTVRDLGSGPDVMQALRDAVNAGLVEGPRILASGPAVSIIGGHADPGTPFNSIVATAHSLGLKVAAHAHGAEGVLMATRAGVDSIDHGTLIDEAGAREMQARGAYLVPTFMTTKQYREARPEAYTPVVWAKIQERMAALGRNVQLARRFGVPIAFGTDAGVYPHGRNGEEFMMLVEFGGMTPRETLVAATANAARLLGLEREIGSLDVGKSADLVAVEADPLQDLATMEQVRFVMARGRVFKQP